MRLLVSNLNRLTTVPHLVDLFLPFGLVSFVKIIMNRYNGDSECVALIEMSPDAGAQAMQLLDDILFMNRYIKVQESRAQV